MPGSRFIPVNPPVRSIDSFVNMAEVMQVSMQHIEEMAAAYYKLTNISPDRVELVQEVQGMSIVWYFRERKQLGQ
jgi:hypothetical protein